LLTTFSLSKPNATILVSEVQTHSKTSSLGMLMALTINAINLNFLDSYRHLTLPKLYVNTFINTGSRLAQNDYQMYVCLAKSVNGDTEENMELERSDYLAGQAITAGHVVLIESSLLYMKNLLDTAHADTWATTAHACNNLAGLDVYMSSLPELDIKEFKKYVKQQPNPHGMWRDHP
jgi:hypothetical protein